MDTVRLSIFERTYTCDFLFEIEHLVLDLRKIKAEIANPQILCYNGFETIDFYLKKIYRSDVCEWIFKNHKTGYENDIRGCLLSLASEDTEWTKTRNEGYTSIFYRKITFNSEIQEEIIKYADNMIDELSVIIDEQATTEKEQEEKRNYEKSALLNGVEWNIEENDIIDEGGRTKKYTHKIIINGAEYIINELNVFDVGRCITDENGLIDFTTINGDVLRAATIVLKYGKYANTTIRM